VFSLQRCGEATSNPRNSLEIMLTLLRWPMAVPNIDG
jgi:hypothetical protein